MKLQNVTSAAKIFAHPKAIPQIISLDFVKFSQIISLDFANFRQIICLDFAKLLR